MKEMELVERHEMFPPMVLYVLLATIVLLSILKFRREIVYTHLRAAFFKPPSTTAMAKEEIGFFGKTHWILLFNYFLVSGLAVYMTLIYLQLDDYWLILTPIGYYYLQVLELYFVGIVSGELKRIQEALLLTHYTSHLLGIIFIPLILVWLLNPQFSQYILYALVIIFVFLQLIRIFRSILSALRNNILWYYIILYLCAFEIWTTILLYILLSSDFVR